MPGPEGKIHLSKIVKNAKIEKLTQDGIRSDDFHVMNERLFSSDSGREASKIVYRLMFGDYEDEQEKEELLDRFESMAEEAALEHFKYRTQAVEKAPFKRCLPAEDKPPASLLLTVADLLHEV